MFGMQSGFVDGFVVVVGLINDVGQASKTGIVLICRDFLGIERMLGRVTSCLRVEWGRTSKTPTVLNGEQLLVKIEELGTKFVIEGVEFVHHFSLGGELPLESCVLLGEIGDLRLELS